MIDDPRTGQPQELPGWSLSISGIWGWFRYQQYRKDMDKIEEHKQFDEQNKEINHD
jgi:hypothetical protein